MHKVMITFILVRFVQENISCWRFFDETGVTYNTIINTTFGSHGSTITTIENTRIGSAGTSRTRIDSSTFCN